MKKTALAAALALIAAPAEALTTHSGWDTSPDATLGTFADETKYTDATLLGGPLHVGDVAFITTISDGVDTDGIVGFDFTPSPAAAYASVSVNDFSLDFLPSKIAIFETLADAKAGTGALASAIVGTGITTIYAPNVNSPLWVKLDWQTPVKANEAVTWAVTHVIPVPGAWLLLMTGGGALVALRRKA